MKKIIIPCMLFFMQFPATAADTSGAVSPFPWELVLLLILVCLVGSGSFLLLRHILRLSTSVSALQAQVERLSEKALHDLSDEITALEDVSASLDALTATYAATSDGTFGEPVHSLIRTIADRITFMEMTLSKMDAGVRGHRQLTKSISQMKDNLLANGYEIVDMLGMPYDAGMKVTATFTEDESLEAGKQVITGIIKPQVNYRGEMIQSAQIMVSQNL